MRQIIPPDGIIWSMLGSQDESIQTWRWSKYVLQYQNEHGWLLYHTLTCELLFVEAEEMKTEVCRDALIRHRFLVEEQGNEYPLISRLRRMRQLVYRAETKEKRNAPIERFWVLTTTSCNANCFYCHEKGIPQMTMTQHTAKDVADYIVEKSCKKPVQLIWYGGEPLINAQVIDLISAELAKKNIVYSSKMISNGYAFDAEMVLRAADLWKLRRIQITLDGQEKTYNHVKRYDVRDEAGSPFFRVIDNIALLLEQKINVVIRLNMELYNENELTKLADRLIDTFGGNPNFSVYTAPLFETCLGTRNNRTKQQRREVYEAHRKLSEKLFEAGVLKKNALARSIESEMRCLAVSSARVIFPDGQLAFCHDYMEDALSGSIYGNEPAFEEREYYTISLPEKEACQTCVRYPQCVRLKKCFNNSCNEETVAEWIWMTKQKMQWAYEENEKAEAGKL